MLPLDKYRAAAKRHAWYDIEEPDPNSFPNYNPFRKIRSPNRVPDDEENPASRIQTNRSENYISTLEAQRRKREADQVKHARTMPAVSPSTQTKPPPNLLNSGSDIRDMAVNQPADLDHDREKDSSEDSGTASGDTAIDSDKTAVSSEVQMDGKKPRKRRFGLFKRKDSDETEQEKPKRRASLFKRDNQKFTFASQLRATLLNSWINVLLVFVPIGIAVNYANVPKVGVFVINFIAIIPLAAMLSYATEEIALRVGETLGGLLNATFG